MVTPKFTPGPRSIGGRCAFVEGEHVAVSIGRDGAAAFFGPNAKAEATLYTTALDLYEALEEILSPGPSQQSGFARGRAALAKARGGR